MYHDSCLYLFCTNTGQWQTDSNIKNQPSSSGHGLSLTDCIVYNCNNLFWHSQTIKPLPITASVQNHLFVYHSHYAIFLVVGSKPTTQILIYIVDINTMTMTQKQANFDSDEGAKFYYSIMANIVKCVIFKDNYLLMIDCLYQQIWAFEISDLINDTKWILLKRITPSKFLKQALMHRYGEIFLIMNNCQLLVCDEKYQTQIICNLYDTEDENIMSLENSNGLSQLHFEYENYVADTKNIHYNANNLDLDQLSSNGDYDRYFFVRVGSRIVALQYDTSTVARDSYSNDRQQLSVLETSPIKLIAVHVSTIWDTTAQSRPRYILSRKIGSGGSSQVYLGTRVSDGEAIIVKQMDGNHDSDSEEKIYAKLKHNQLSWISCHFYERVCENKRKYLIFEKLGVSLQHLLTEKIDYSSSYNGKGTLSLNHVLSIVDRMIIILCKLHGIGYAHNDIKPENILIGDKEEQFKTNQLYLIDFGIATPFWDFKNNKHLPINASVSFNGTFRFSSKNHHCNGFSTSRRDDLESLIYLAIYLLTGTLPWREMNDENNIRNQPFTTKGVILQKTKNVKQNSSIECICAGIPKVFATGLIYARSLKFDEKPDYLYLQNLFRKLHKAELQIITSNALLNLTNSENNKQQLDTNTVIINKHHYRGYMDFLGCYVPISESIAAASGDASHKHLNESKEEEKMTKNDSTQSLREQDKLVSKKLTDIAVNYLNEMGKNGTITNHPTHMSIHGMRNRFGDLINSLTIVMGVPNKMPTDISYGGIVIYQKSNDSDELNGQIYMLSSSQCDITNKEYAKKTGLQLGGIVHGAIYYYYFKQNIFNTKDKNRKHKLSFIRGFSLEANGTLKCRSGAFNFIGYKLIDDKYKPLAKCEEKFIDCALKRYWNDSMQRKTNFQQYVECEHCVRSSMTRTRINPNPNLEAKVGDSETCSSELKNNEYFSTLVPNYTDKDVDPDPVRLYSKVELLWNANIIPIIEFLNNRDKVTLFCVSKQARLLMNHYCMWKSKCNHQRSKLSDNWYYICKIQIDTNSRKKTIAKYSPKHTQSLNIFGQSVDKQKSSKYKNETLIKIKKPSKKYSNSIESNQSTVDLWNWQYNPHLRSSEDVLQLDKDTSTAENNYNNQLQELVTFLVIMYHPLLQLLIKEDGKRMLSQQIEYDENMKLLLLLKFFGIYDFVKNLNPNRDECNNETSTTLLIDGTKYVWQPQWSWDRNDKWMQYDIDTCIQIEES